MINAMSYVVVNTPHLKQWLPMVSDHIGLHVDVVEADVAVRLRMDSKVQRLLLLATPGKASLTMGYEVDDACALLAVRQALVAAGYPVVEGTIAEIALRGVADMFYFLDPDTNRIEVVWGLGETSEPLCPGRPIGGFRTGELGIGHVALMTANFERMCQLYKEVLGFRTSDRASAPFKVEFLHVNPRHHSLGLADTGTGAGVYHLMLEYNDFDDVGRAYDIALENPDCIGVTLGRHINDHVTSFYLKNPDGWMFELGWAGRTIGPDWQVEELPGMSLWGHDRTWLPPQKREAARQILKQLSARGLRAPVVIPKPTENS
jgi:2,3-dihydroxybiphenyl 1,2-dioxygenase